MTPLLFRREGNLLSAGYLRGDPLDAVGRKDVTTPRDHQARDVDAREDITPIHESVVKEEGRRILVAHLGVLLQDPREVRLGDGPGKHAPHKSRRLRGHVVGYAIDLRGREKGREPCSLLVRPLRVPHHDGRLVHQNEVADVLASAWILVPPRPCDGASHGVADNR